MAGPTNVASPLASEPKENGQVGTAAGDEERAGGASEGHEAAEAANASKLNGATRPGPDATPNKTSATENEDQDVNMKDPADTEEAAATPANTQTPASGKKASNGSSKKKAAVPEHKSKKLNKKASSKRLTNLDAEPGQYYLARMKGHPPWPSVICDEEMLPMSLLDTRPVTTKLPDGTYKKAEYADGGKRTHQRVVSAMIIVDSLSAKFASGERKADISGSAWMPNTDLTPLDPASIDTDDTKGKSKPLVAAYAKASEDNDLQHFKDMLADHQKAVKEEQEAQAERDAKKSAKGKRKSVDTAAAADDEDEMDIDEDEEEPKPKSKKRKKEADSDGEEKPAKTPKTGTKLKLSTPKTPAEPSSKKKAAPKPKSSSKKAAKSSDDDAAVETPKVEEKKLTAEETRHLKEKRVLYFRHKLQRGFLSRDVPPKDDEMKSMSEFLAELETYQDLEGVIIRTTKINKVLKGMIKLTSIPHDEVYHFKDRSLKLLTRWNDTLAKEGPGASGDKDDDGKAEPAVPITNGTTNDSEEQARKAEAGEAAAPEEESNETLEKKIGTTAEGEGDAEKDAPSKADVEQVDSNKGDEADVESAPAKEYQPPTVEAAS
ncbi:MAG: hypothetical protein LQ341_005508 [Variospora aurantia]|nr:MAG: hypothetical protein LQ341_005508 [Variospora aurantia]